MRLHKLLNKFTNAAFLLTIDGLCEELSFYEYEKESREKYWEKYDDRKVKSLAIIMTNGQPELCITLEAEEKNG